MFCLFIIFLTQVLNCCLQPTEVVTKTVTCVSTEGQEAVYVMVETIENNNVKRLSDDIYITPKNKTVLFICTNTDVCSPVNFTSITELNSSLILKTCFTKTKKNHTYQCETIRFNHLIHMDKLSFLSKTIPDKSVYLFNCLVKSNGTQVCHKKADDAYIKQVHKLNQTLASVIDELICEKAEATNDKHDYLKLDTQSRRGEADTTIISISGVVSSKASLDFVKKSNFNDTEIGVARQNDSECKVDCQFVVRQKLDLITP